MSVVVVVIVIVAVVVIGRGDYPERTVLTLWLASMRDYAAHHKGACGIGPRVVCRIVHRVILHIICPIVHQFVCRFVKLYVGSLSHSAAYLHPPIITAVALKGLLVKMRSGVFEQIGFALGLELAKVALVSGSSVNGFHVLHVRVPSPRFERARFQIALVDDVGGVDELVASEVVLEPRFVLAVVDAALERLLVKVGALMIEQIGFSFRVEIAHVAFPRLPRVVAHGRAYIIKSEVKRGGGGMRIGYCSL